MKTYQCHKIVKAAQITGVGPQAKDCSVDLFLDDGSKFVAHSNMVFRYWPEIGDYLIEYDPDGYRSISPKTAFESGYTLIQE